MKVFNWVHRRFLPMHSCIAYPQGESGQEKGMRSKVDVEKHALLEHGVMVDMIDDWNDGGILAIGTLAIGPLDLENTKCDPIDQAHDDVHVENNHDDEHHDYDQDDDDYEASPLMKVELFTNELEKFEGDTCKNTDEIVGEEDNNANCDVLKDKNDTQTKRRVTLADLFLEDSDHHLVNKVKTDASNDVAPKKIVFITKPKDFNTKPTSQPKHGLNQAKKFLKEELSPLKKLNQLMKRMMKKKIHPDMEMKKDIQMETRTRNDNLGIPTNNHLYEEASDSLSLLLIPDSII